VCVGGLTGFFGLAVPGGRVVAVGPPPARGKLAPHFGPAQLPCAAIRVRLATSGSVLGPGFRIHCRRRARWFATSNGPPQRRALPTIRGRPRVVPPRTANDGTDARPGSRGGLRTTNNSAGVRRSANVQMFYNGTSVEADKGHLRSEDPSGFMPKAISAMTDAGRAKITYAQHSWI